MAEKKLAHLTAWRAFEAVARHSSFLKASQELSVTPGAVSQQVKLLEDYYGVRLFRRQGRQTALTDEAAAIFPEIAAGFDLLARATTQLQSRRAEGVVRITAPPTFAVKWLVHRLGDFSLRNPGIQISLDSTEAIRDLKRDPVDVAIRFGRGDWPGVYRHLLDELITPVCSPDYLERHPIHTPQDLCQVQLIHDRTMDSTSLDYPDWDRWFAEAGVNGSSSGALHFSSSLAAIQAAIDGHGVVLGRSPTVHDELKSGHLVAPLGLGTPSGNGYFLLSAHEEPFAPRIAAFIEWLVSEAAEFSREVAGLPRR